LDRRSMLKRGLVLLGGGLVLGAARRAAAEAPPGRPPSMIAPGAGMSGYGAPSPYEGKVTRTLIRSQPGTTGSGASRTPLESPDRTITSSALHFERHHSGVPEIDPALPRVVIHGRVARPLTFAVDDLLRYPMTTRIVFIECAGNSLQMYGATPAALTCGQI